MAFNGSGVFLRLRNWVADAAAGVKIRADLHDTEDDNFAAGISNCIARDGQSLITQNIPFNSKRITGLADPVDAQDAATKHYADTKMPLSGGPPVTGNIIIDKTEPVLEFDNTGLPNQGGGVSGAVDGKSRWLMRLGDGSAETGGDAGSDFDLIAYSDSEAFNGRALFFDRATALGTVIGNPTAPLGIATKQLVDAVGAGKLSITGGEMTGQFNTAVSNGIGTAGSNIGSIMVQGAPGGNAAMQFRISGTFAANFGMAASGDFYIGGGSFGDSVYYQVWTSRDFNAPAVVTALEDLKARIEALERRA
jgi:hypothetical protein